ncbi:MAG: hypothetical protein R3Y60_03285 [bacterium]
MKDLLAKIEAPHPMGLPLMMALPQNLAALSLDEKKKALNYFVKSALEALTSNKVEMTKKDRNYYYHHGAFVPKEEEEQLIALTDTDKQLIVSGTLVSLSPLNDDASVREAEFVAINEALKNAGINGVEVANEEAHAQMTKQLDSEGTISELYADFSNAIEAFRTYIAQPGMEAAKKALFFACYCASSIAEPTLSMRKMGVTANLMSM